MTFSVSCPVVRKMKFETVIPIYNQATYTKMLFDCIGRNTFISTIHIIDNGSADDSEKLIRSFDYPLRYHRLEANAGVNAAWNLAVSLSDADVICFLNNDLLIPDFFFEKMSAAFEQHEQLGYLVPVTVNSQDAVFLAKPPEGIGSFIPLLRREGWAFCLRRSVAIKTGPIPFYVQNFFGDDWFYNGTRIQRMVTAKLLDVPIFHYGSVTVNANEIQHTLKKERESWIQNYR